MKKVFSIMAFSLACAGVISCVAAKQSAESPSQEGARIVSAYNAVFLTPAKRIPSNCSTDAPLMGNGDLLAALGGSAEKLQFYLCKADLWELRPDGGPRALSRLDVEFPDMKGVDYLVTQNLLHATTTARFKKKGVTLTAESAVAATENLLWVKLSVTGGAVTGSARLKGAGDVSVPMAIDDNDRPVTIGRETYGNGRYYFDGEMADVTISMEPVCRPPTEKPLHREAFDGRTTFREAHVPRMDKKVSIGAWIKINRSGEANYIVSKGDWNNAYSFGLSGGCLRWAVNGEYIQTAKPLPTGQWLPVAATFDGRAMRIFVNGAQVTARDSIPANGLTVVERCYDNNVSIPTGAACALKVVDGHEGGFTVQPGKPVFLVVAATGLANTPDYRADAVKRAKNTTSDSLLVLQSMHNAWWAGFWNKSFVEIPDKVLEQRYYLSHYGMASCSRLPHFPPGLYGWTLSEGTPMWGGAYFNNYNFFAPFYGLYAANHIEQAMPCNDAVMDAIELGREWCRDEAKYERACGNSLKLKMDKGILLPVSMLPDGITGARTTWGQRTDASYACVPLASTWYATYDLAFAKRAYPFVRETAIFWEHFLVLEPTTPDGLRRSGNGRYVDRNDAVLENSGRDTNPIVALALIRQVMSLALEMSMELGVDAEHRAKWADIRDRLSDYPTCTVRDLSNGCRIAESRTEAVQNLPIFRYSEKGCAWQNDNAVGIQHIFPGNGIGLGVRPELLERARNQVRVMGRWIDLNGCNSFYPAAVRVGYEPEEILGRLRHWVDTASANGMRDDNPHGTEQFSVVPCTIQEMLMQSYDGTLRLFPNWPKDQDARFGTLRARGAFLVSAELKAGEVRGVRITSEKGRDCTIQNPWPGKKVRLVRTHSTSSGQDGKVEAAPPPGG